MDKYVCTECDWGGDLDEAITEPHPAAPEADVILCPKCGAAALIPVCIGMTGAVEREGARDE